MKKFGEGRSVLLGQVTGDEIFAGCLAPALSDPESFEGESKKILSPGATPPDLNAKIITSGRTRKKIL